MTDGTGVTPEPKKDAGVTPEVVPTDAGDVDGLKSALKAERATRSAAEKRLRDQETRLRELEDRDKSETERLSARATESDRRASEAETKALRYEFAAKHGLDFEAAQHISGSTPEEIQASATHLAEVIAARAATVKPAGSFDGGARHAPDPNVKPEQAHNAWLLAALGRTPE